VIHVIPLGDKIPHTADCRCCNPYMDPGGIWIHHSVDNREQYERQGKTTNRDKPWQLCREDEATGELIPIEG